MEKTRTLLLALTTVLLLCGCVSPPEKKTASGPEETVFSIVQGFDQKNASTFDRIEEAVDLGKEAVPPSLQLLESEDLYDRWAAVYILSRVTSDLQEEQKADVLSKLRDAFDDPDPTIRTIAAGTAVGNGDKTGIPTLIESLGNDEPMLLSEPRKALSKYSFEVLSYYCGETFGYDPQTPLGDRESSIRRWRSWWEENKDSLSWDPAAQKYVR